jgi:hypothetical protein
MSLRGKNGSHHRDCSTPNVFMRNNSRKNYRDNNAHCQSLSVPTWKHRSQGQSVNRYTRPPGPCLGFLESDVGRSSFDSSLVMTQYDSRPAAQASNVASVVSTEAEG